MPDSSLLVSADTLTRFGFRDPDAAAQEIAELAEAIFGPFDPVTAEGWALSAAQELAPAELRQQLRDAVEAEDPLAVVARHREARTMLERHLQPRWSSPRGRSLGHPPGGLQGHTTWASLSETAREEVREALRHLHGFWASRVRRHRPKREDFDTFLRELAEIFVRYAGPSSQVEHLVRSTDVPHSDRSRFIQLAELVLEGLPPLPSGEARVHPGLRSVRGLSERWERIKEHEATGWAELDKLDEDDTPAS